MSSTDTTDKQDWEDGKMLIRNLSQTDGTLVSPIDLTLEMTQPLYLDKLRWLNFNDVPKKLKITNTGETVILSAKWEKIRPYLNCGPLEGNYVFSQLHFHWGRDEHEGSEHTAGGIRYPMEMHVIFYKTGYLTQAAALKHDDGLVTLVYLVKLQDKSTPGLEMLSTHLGQVMQPYNSVALPLVPLSSILVPFTRDYFLYWGSLVTRRCSHKVLWFVSRAALGISAIDLDRFRSLLDSNGGRMNQNFRATNDAQGRTVLHVNPSVDMRHLLHAGTVEPPGKVVPVIVNYSKVSALDQQQAFNKINMIGDWTDNNSKDSNTNVSSNKSQKELKTCVFSKGSIKLKKSNPIESSKERGSSIISSSVRTSDSNSSRISSYFSKTDDLRQSKSQKRNNVATRKFIERERRQVFQRKQLEQLETLRKHEVLEEQNVKLSGFTSASNKSLLTARAHRPLTFRKRAEKINDNIQAHTEQSRTEGESSPQTTLCVQFDYPDSVSEPSVEKDEHIAENPLNDSITARLAEIIMNGDETSEYNRKENAAEKIKPVLKSKLPVPVQMNRCRQLTQTSLGERVAKTSLQKQKDIRAERESRRRQTADNNRVMRRQLSRTSNREKLDTSIPKPVTSIPKPSINKPRRTETERDTKGRTAQSPISKNSPKIPSEVCFG